MFCPRCTIEMAQKPLGDVRVDVCPDCRGTWFDRGELESVRKVESGAKRAARTVFELDAAVALSVCPRCKSAQLATGRAHGFVVERCNGCQGMFLDGDEIGRLLGEWAKRRSHRHALDRNEELLVHGLPAFLSALLD